MRTFYRAYQFIAPCMVLAVIVLTYSGPAYAPNRRIQDDACANYTLPSNFSITVTNEIVDGTRKFKGCLKNAGEDMPTMFSSANLKFEPIDGSPTCFSLTKKSPFAAKETFHFSIRLHENNEHGCFGKYELTIENSPIPTEPCPDGSARDPFGVCPKDADTDEDTDPTDCDEGYFYDGDFEECLPEDEDDSDDEDEDDSEDVVCLSAEILINGACYANTVKKPITPPPFFPPTLPPSTNQTAGTGGGGGCSLMVRP